MFETRYMAMKCLTNQAGSNRNVTHIDMRFKWLGPKATLKEFDHGFWYWFARPNADACRWPTQMIAMLKPRFNVLKNKCNFYSQSFYRLRRPQTRWPVPIFHVFSSPLPFHQDREKLPEIKLWPQHIQEDEICIFMGLPEHEITQPLNATGPY